jgi:hypothetical protein
MSVNISPLGRFLTNKIRGCPSGGLTAPNKINSHPALTNIHKELLILAGERVNIRPLESWRAIFSAAKREFSSRGNAKNDS